HCARRRQCVLVYGVPAEEWRVVARVQDSLRTQVTCGKLGSACARAHIIEVCALNPHLSRYSHVSSHIHAPGQQPAGPQPLPGVDSVIAVGSGKGGVGKTTLAVNLAIALARMGFKVGLLDADVYGPNVPLMLGTSVAPNVVGEDRILPPERYGLKVMSV